MSRKQANLAIDKSVRDTIEMFARAHMIEIEAVERAMEQTMFIMVYDDLKTHLDKLNRELREAMEKS